MYPNNIKIEKLGKIKAINEKLRSIKNDIMSQIKYIVHNRKNLSKIILVKLHI